MGDNTRTAIVISVILLILFLILLGLFKFLGAEESEEDGTPAWTVGPPPDGPGTATDGGFDEAPVPSAPFWTILVQTLIEQALDQNENQIQEENENQTQAQNDMNETIAEIQDQLQTQLDLIEAGDLTSEQVQAQLEETIAEIQDQLQTQLELIEAGDLASEQVQAQLEETIAEIEDQLQTQLELIRAGDLTSEQVQIQLEETIAEIKDQLQTQLELVGAEVLPEEQVQEQIEETIAEIQDQLQTQLDLIEAGDLTSEQVQAQLEETIAEIQDQLQTQLELIEAGDLASEQVQAQLEETIAEIEDQLQTQLELIRAGDLTSEQVQIQLEETIAEIKDQLQTQLELVGAEVLPEEQVQEQIEETIAEIQDQLQTQLDLIEAGDLTSEQVQAQLEETIAEIQDQLQTQLELIEAGDLASEQVQAQLEETIAEIEDQLQTQLELIRAGDLTSEQVQIQLEETIAEIKDQLQTQLELVGAEVLPEEQVQEQIEELQEQLQAEVNAQVSAGVTVNPVLTTVQEQLELIRQEFNSSLTASQPTIQIIQNISVQERLQALQDQLQAEVNAQVSAGVTVNPVLTTVQEQLELIRQEFNSSLTASQPTIQIIQNISVQEQLQALQDQLQAEVNAQVSAGVTVNPVLTTVQEQLELIRQEFNSSLTASQPTIQIIQNISVQEQLQALQDQLQAEVNAQVSAGVTVNPVLTTVQEQLELIRQEFNSSLTASQPTIQIIQNISVQERLQALQDQIQAEMNTGSSRGEINPLIASDVQEQLESIRTQIEYSMKQSASISARKGKKPHARIASAEVARIVEGKAQINEDSSGNWTLTRTFNQSFNSRGQVGAFAYAPRRGSARIAEWGRKIKAYMLTQKAKVKNSKLYQSFSDPWNNIDFEKTFNKAGYFALEFVDFFDKIADRIAIVCMFVDSFLYDPDGTGLDWYPLSDKSLGQVAQNSVKLQIEEFQIYNDSLGPDEIKSKYPLVAGPLDFLDENAPSGRSSRDDPEYAQRRVEYEVDAIRIKMLSNPDSPYRKKIIEFGFDRLEEELQAYLAEDPLNSILDYDGVLPPVDWDNLYIEAYSEVCKYHYGKVYIDTYTDTDGNARRQPKCGWPDSATCEFYANQWINENGQIGNYGEWFTWNQLNEIFTKIKQEDPTFVPPINSDSPFFPALRDEGMCIVTGAGQRHACNDANGIYDPINHRCVFTPKICQYYGTCYKQSSNNCYIPESLDHVQSFFGNYFPREWIRLYGCLDDESDLGNFKQIMGDVGNFLTIGGQRFITDIVANKKNYKAGAKATLTDPTNIANLAMIFGPGMLGLSTGVTMIIIAFIVGGTMAEQALSLNREVAQLPPSIPAEYTTGGWMTNTTFKSIPPIHDVTNITYTLYNVNDAYLTITTSTPHGLVVGDRFQQRKLKYYILGTNTGEIAYENYISLYEFTVQSATLTTITTNYFRKLLAIDGVSNFENVYLYKAPGGGTYKYIRPAAYQYDIHPDSYVKTPVKVGYIPGGWVTKPLRPKKSDGSLVSTTEGVNQITGSVEMNFFIDVKPGTAVNQQVLPNGCSSSQYGLTVINSPCVNSTYNTNYSFASEDWGGLDLAHLYKCLVKGMGGFWAFSEECKKATAVNAATGFIPAPNGIVSEGWEWAGNQLYKKLCSQRDKYGLGEPMIRGWDAPYINKVWCLPEKPPIEWANPNIGPLYFAEKMFSRNRSWTSGVDEYDPVVHEAVYTEGGNYEVGDSAKYWYYQLVYDPELFNRDALWNDSLMNENFAAHTISEMRQYYCLEDFVKFQEKERLADLDDRCWGYLAISTNNYTFTPMTVAGKFV